MALVPNTLILELSKFIDQDSPVFESFPATKEIAAARWADAFIIYLSTIIPATIFATHRAALISLILSHFNAQNFYISFDSILNWMGTMMTGSMPGFVSGILPLTTTTIPIFAINKSKSAAQFINQLVPIVDTYFRTGIAQIITGGPPFPWS